jgi:putative ABC transport system substrate-binding protein
MRGFLRFLVIGAVLLPALAAGEEQRRPFRVGVLFWHDSPNDAIAFEGVKRGFALGRIPVEFDPIDVAKDADRARAVLESWETREYDLVYAMGTQSALIAKSVLRRLPVVFTAVTHPVGSGVTRDWSGSGGSLCGNSNWIDRSEIFRVFQEAVPNLARLGVILNPANPVSGYELAEARTYLRAHPDQKRKLLVEYVEGPDDVGGATEAVVRDGAQAVWIPIDDIVYKNLDAVSKVTRPKRIPLLSSQYSAVEEHHAVVGVAVDYRLLGMKSVVFAKRILVDGADPGDLAVGRMASYRVVVSLPAGRRTGYRIPLGLLARADEILDLPLGER